MSPRKDYPRDKPGMRMVMGGMDTVHPMDAMPPTKLPFAQNVRAYLKDRTSARATQDSSVAQLAAPVHTIRRLNDTTPDGPTAGFTLVSAAGSVLYAAGVPVAEGLSGNPLSVLPFRPNASVQPWAYIGDSAQSGVTIGVDSGVGYPVPNGMLKVRSDGPVTGLA